MTEPSEDADDAARLEEVAAEPEDRTCDGNNNEKTQEPAEKPEADTKQETYGRGPRAPEPSYNSAISSCEKGQQKSGAHCSIGKCYNGAERGPRAPESFDLKLKDVKGGA